MSWGMPDLKEWIKHLENIGGNMNCTYCGQFHTATTCHRIKAIEYHPNGAVKRVELHDFFVREPIEPPRKFPDINDYDPRN